MTTKSTQQGKTRDPMRVAESLAAQHFAVDTNTIHKMIEEHNNEFQALLDALGDQDSLSEIVRLENKVRAALPEALENDVIDLLDLKGEDGTRRMEAGFLLGVAVGRRGGAR